MTDQLLLAQAAPRRKVLLSAFACSPLWGSEPGVGWRWAIELAQRHEVTVLTHSYFKQQIDAELAQRPRAGLHFAYFEAPSVSWHPHRQLNSRLYYAWWQWNVRSHARKLLREAPHDLIHHLTWSGYRQPSFLGDMGIPLVVGPVGGGEGAPGRLYRSWPWREQLFYRARALSIALSRFDPFVRTMMSQAACVMTKTPQTLAALPRMAHARCFQAMEVGVTLSPQARIRDAEHISGTPLKLLYAGRLLGGKGVIYALDCVQALRARGVHAELTVAGDGRLDGWLRQRAAAHGVEAAVHFLGKVAREDMDALYDAHDLLLFPSWHDSGGSVVTEALSRGLPVACLDIGGPRQVVDEGCAVIAPTAGLDEKGLASALADQIEPLAHDRGLLTRLSQGALTRATDMSWDRQVARAYDEIEHRLGWPRATVAA